jgi:hypothetical protein
MRKFRSKSGSFIFLFCIYLVLINRNGPFWYNLFIAHLNVNSCSMALFRSIELEKHHPLYFMN